MTYLHLIFVAVPRNFLSFSLSHFPLHLLHPLSLQRTLASASLLPSPLYSAFRNLAMAREAQEEELESLVDILGDEFVPFDGTGGRAEGAGGALREQGRK